MDLDPYLTLYTKNVQTDLKENNIKTKPQEGYLKTTLYFINALNFTSKLEIINKTISSLAT